MIKYIIAKLAARLGVFESDAIDALRYDVEQWKTWYFGESLKNWLLRRDNARLGGRKDEGFTK